MSSSKNLDYKKTSFLNKSNSAFIEQMYLKFINQDSNLPESWKNYFLDLGENIDLVIKELKGPSWSRNKKKVELDIIQKKIEKDSYYEKKNNYLEQKDFTKANSNSVRAVSLIRSYRQRGHLIAKVDPLEIREIEYLDELHPENYGFKKEDYKKKIYLDGAINKEYSNIKEILSFLKKNLLRSNWL